MKNDKYYEFCRGHYYLDPVNGEPDELWEPFEGYEDVTIESFIKNDVTSLKRFIKGLRPKDWDE